MSKQTSTSKGGRDEGGAGEEEGGWEDPTDLSDVAGISSKILCKPLLILLALAVAGVFAGTCTLNTARLKTVDRANEALFCNTVGKVKCSISRAGGVNGVKALYNCLISNPGERMHFNPRHAVTRNNVLKIEKLVVEFLMSLSSTRGGFSTFLSSSLTPEQNLDNFFSALRHLDGMDAVDLGDNPVERLMGAMTAIRDAVISPPPIPTAPQPVDVIYVSDSASSDSRGKAESRAEKNKAVAAAKDARVLKSAEAAARLALEKLEAQKERLRLKAEKDAANEAEKKAKEAEKEAKKKAKEAEKEAKEAEKSKKITLSAEEIELKRKEDNERRSATRRADAAERRSLEQRAQEETQKFTGNVTKELRRAEDNAYAEMRKKFLAGELTEPPRRTSYEGDFKRKRDSKSESPKKKVKAAEPVEKVPIVFYLRPGGRIIKFRPNRPIVARNTALASKAEYISGTPDAIYSAVARNYTSILPADYFIVPTALSLRMPNYLGRTGPPDDEWNHHWTHPEEPARLMLDVVRTYTPHRRTQDPSLYGETVWVREERKFRAFGVFVLDQEDCSLSIVRKTQNTTVKEVDGYFNCSENKCLCCKPLKNTTVIGEGCKSNIFKFAANSDLLGVCSGVNCGRILLLDRWIFFRCSETGELLLDEGLPVFDSLCIHCANTVDPLYASGRKLYRKMNVVERRARLTELSLEHEWHNADTGGVLNAEQRLAHNLRAARHLGERMRGPHPERTADPRALTEVLIPAPIAASTTPFNWASLGKFSNDLPLPGSFGGANISKNTPSNTPKNIPSKHETERLSVEALEEDVKRIEKAIAEYEDKANIARSRRLTEVRDEFNSLIRKQTEIALVGRRLMDNDRTIQEEMDRIGREPSNSTLDESLYPNDERIRVELDMMDAKRVANRIEIEENGDLRANIESDVVRASAALKKAEEDMKGKNVKITSVRAKLDIELLQAKLKLERRMRGIRIRDQRNSTNDARALEVLIASDRQHRASRLAAFAAFPHAEINQIRQILRDFEEETRADMVIRGAIKVFFESCDRLHRFFRGDSSDDLDNEEDAEDRLGCMYPGLRGTLDPIERFLKYTYVDHDMPDIDDIEDIYGRCRNYFNDKFNALYQGLVALISRLRVVTEHIQAAESAPAFHVINDFYREHNAWLLGIYQRMVDVTKAWPPMRAIIYPRPTQVHASTAPRPLPINHQPVTPQPPPHQPPTTPGPRVGDVFDPAGEYGESADSNCSTDNSGYGE